MEHLPEPKRRAPDPIEVPYVVIEDIHMYDGERLTFSQFRQAHGFDEQTIERQGWNAYAQSNPGGGQTESGRVVESFLQEWLFFGLLYEVLREDFKREDFLCKKEGSPWTITTSNLPGLLWIYKRRWTSMSYDQLARAQRSTRTWACLDEASDFVNKFLGSESKFISSESKRLASIQLQEWVILSITIIVSTLSAAVAEVYNRAKFVITRPKCVDTLLLDHHWCPTALAMLERQGFGPQGMFYAAMLGPLPSKRDHIKNFCSNDDFECKANNVDRDTYETAHAPDCKDVEHVANSNCPFEYVGHDSLCTEVESVGTHPVVVVLNESDPTFRLDLRRSNSHQPYVAISHVWMDGMGNNDGNALPRCQLWRLQRLVNSLYGTAQTEPIPFWIDTLCVPRKPKKSKEFEKSKEFRKKAINKMKDTYKDADKILVLDANLFTNPLASCKTDPTEIFMRILSTNWMRRLWTLQEGVLGKSLHFVFPDGIVDVQESVSSLETHFKVVSSSMSQPKDSQLPNIYPGQVISLTALEQYKRLRGLSEKREGEKQEEEKREEEKREEEKREEEKREEEKREEEKREEEKREEEKREEEKREEEKREEEKREEKREEEKREEEKREEEKREEEKREEEKREEEKREEEKREEEKREEKKREEQKLAIMWDNMQWRSTSWASDETICMATILGFTQTEIGELQGVEVVSINDKTKPEDKASLEGLQRTQLAARYKLFLNLLKRHQTRIPMGLVFARGDKFNEPGFRWAPSSFFRTAAKGTIVAAEPVGQLTDAGLEFSAPGFELYLPPTQFKSRFVMLDELTSTFYAVDYETLIIGNKVKWEDLAPESIQDPALILSENVPLMSPDARIGAFGLLVSITQRTEQTLVATYLGHVFVKKFPASVMNWEALTNMKGAARTTQMKDGLMARLWNRRPGVPQSSGPPQVTSPETLDQVPDRWREDGAALNYELDGTFASSRNLPPKQKWCLG